MKFLSIIRHAKTERPANYSTDFVRPLTARGHKDTKHMAKLLAQIDPAVDWLVSSTAVRARETTEHLADLLAPEHIAWTEDVYLAAAETLLAVLKKSPQPAEHVAIVGHNPGMAELVSGLCTGSAQRLNLHMSTGALAHLELEIFRWDQLRWGSGRLRLFMAPKFMRKKS